MARHSKNRSFVATLLAYGLRVAGGLAIVASCCWLSLHYVYHTQLLAVETGSMRPAFAPGDAVLVRRMRPNQLAVGQVVSYRSPRNPNELVSHRVIGLQTGSFQTKGDHLTMPDPMARDALLNGRIVAVLPGLGRLIALARSWPGLVLGVYVPAAVVTAHELVRLERQYKSLSDAGRKTQQVVS